MRSIETFSGTPSSPVVTPTSIAAMRALLRSRHVAASSSNCLAISDILRMTPLYRNPLRQEQFFRHREYPWLPQALPRALPSLCGISRTRVVRCPPSGIKGPGSFECEFCTAATCLSPVPLGGQLSSMLRSRLAQSHGRHGVKAWERTPDSAYSAQRSVSRALAHCYLWLPWPSVVRRRRDWRSWVLGADGGR